MTKQKIEMIFSLLFFFFSLFLFLSIISSLLIVNFDNLLLIMLKPDGFFVQITRIVLFCGFCFSLYLYKTRYIKKDRKYNNFIIFGMFLFIILLLTNIFFNPKGDDLQNMLEIYSYKESHTIINSTKKLFFDSVVFIYFVMIPALSFFYKRRVYDSYFYQTYIREIAPSLNVSIIFLFGYVIQEYDFSNIYSIIDIILSIFSIALFLRIAISSRYAITLYSVVNLFLLCCGFIIFILSRNLLEQCNLFYASSFFYALGLLYWFLNISIKLEH
ncbi:hypothetical protein CCY99_07725 [Helicobacter sp. 16-1353]|uniref:hypothetical protein n=1 Tax=Helicobacter sp. 16-1353 TaxID=2004996 RepID=UPI000DCB2CF1|nr:hypothetical protein [Helicobacter sp. 16-1353]RAX52270.1 hypothetical protein CCY99_07725 [Helicobacter sp. 16-1353]